MIDIFQVGRNIKHQIFITQNRVQAKKSEKIEEKIIKKNRITKFQYNPNKYIKTVSGHKLPNSFTFKVNHLEFNQKNISETRPCPLRIFTVWAGGNEITKNRKKSLNILKRANSTLDFVIITPENIDEWVVPSDPLPSVLKNLSYNHQSDFLRAYLMHHHGGVYIDIKAVDASWQGIIEELNSNPKKVAAGPREVSTFNCSPAEGPLGRDQKDNFSRLLCVSGLACKPGTSFTAEWLAEVKRRIKYFEDILVENPAEQPWGMNREYPVPWNCLGGSVFSPLCLKYHDLLIADNDSELSINFIHTFHAGNHR